MVLIPSYSISQWARDGVSRLGSDRERGESVTYIARLEYAVPCVPHTVLRSRTTGRNGRVRGNDGLWLHTWGGGRGGRSEIGASCTAGRGCHAPAESVVGRCICCTRREGLEHVQLNFDRWAHLCMYFGSVVLYLRHHHHQSRNILRYCDILQISFANNRASSHE